MAEMTDEQMAQTPETEQIAAMAKAQGQLIGCGQTLSMLTQSMMQSMQNVTLNNPRLCYAISSELKLIFAEALRQGIKINEQPAPAVSADEKTEGEA